MENFRRFVGAHGSEPSFDKSEHPDEGFLLEFNKSGSICGIKSYKQHTKLIKESKNPAKANRLFLKKWEKTWCYIFEASGKNYDQLQKIANEALIQGLIDYNKRHGWRGGVGKIDNKNYQLKK